MRIIRNFDVGSYYPHLMTINGYTSRNLPNPAVYSSTLERRMAAKKAGDTARANALKLVCNTAYGATLNRYNPMYDPLMARSVCISGQLYLLELSCHLLHDIPDLRVIQLNTDGIMIEFDDSQYQDVLAITDEWQQRTGFSLEEDKVSRLYQSNVNNYVEVGDNGQVKIKGGYLVRGIAKAGAFNINNNATIVAKAIKEYFVNHTPVDVTINECQEVKEFQLIAKAGTMYREAYHMVDGERFPVQRVNRVYASSDPRYGKVYKVKAENNQEALIGSLPEHCIIDNTAIDSPGHTKIDQIDKTWYITQALAGVNKFLGIKPEKKTRKKEKKTMAAEKKTLNVYQKLMEARIAFAQSDPIKSGKNTDLKFRYFELEDIVPTALKIFKEVGLIPICTFDRECAYMAIVDMDNPESKIEFTSPMKDWEGNRAVNPIQTIGAAETYQRRYLYMMALDICEADDIDATPAPTPPPAQVAATKREEVTKALTDTKEEADTIMKQKAQELVLKVQMSKPEHKDWCNGVAKATMGFTKIPKDLCAALIQEATKRLGKEE